MTKCPSCRMVYERQPRFCESCGYQFATDPKANIGSRKKLTRAQLGGLSALAIIVALWFVGRTTPESGAGGGGRPATPPTSSTSPERASIGATVGIVEGKGFWPCGSSPEAYDELMKWAVRGDDSEVKRTLVRTRSVGLTSGLRVKILDVGFGKRKVRVLGLYSDGRLYSEDPRTGHECWVASEALTY